MRRWLLAAVGIALAGIIVAFYVVTYGVRDCPGAQDCYTYGTGPRMLTLLVTGVVVLGLLTVAIINSTNER